MKQVLFVVTILISLDMFAMGSRKPAPKPAPVEPTSCEGAIDSGTVTYDLKFIDNSYTTQVRKDRVSRLTTQAMAVVNSEEFKKRVLGSWYKGKYAFADTTDSNETVYKKIRESSEVFHKCVDYKWELEYQWDSNSKKVLGWTYANVKTVWFNYKNFDPRTDSGIVGTICHEHMHKLGYDHSSASSSQSVPYAVGTICAELYDKMYKKN